MAKVKRYDPAPVQWKRKRGWLFYLFLIPIFFSVIFALFALNIKALLLNVLAFVMMYGTFFVAKKGFEQEDIYNEKKLTKAPKTPFKQIAAIMLAITTFYLAYIAGNYTLFNSLFLSAISIVGFWLYYGFDPRKDKLKDFGDISSELILKTLNDTTDKINLIKKDADKIGDRVLSDKVHLAIKKADNIFDALVDDPKDIRVARKFLVVYLDGIADVIGSYTEVEEEHISEKTRGRLLELMKDVEKRFEKELMRLKANNLFDLDVNIDTLKEQIKH
ncbi:MAG: 5-bromo-4-chloroindolyl phosphate hydrolysis family protein [Campylobacterota bacterium]|nr:5-bromo-4-chloroindolyl phosphate hydrolysis family protein [Campylobacterota bacterium]